METFRYIVYFYSHQCRAIYFPTLVYYIHAVHGPIATIIIFIGFFLRLLMLHAHTPFSIYFNWFTNLLHIIFLVIPCESPLIYLMNCMQFHLFFGASIISLMSLSLSVRLRKNVLCKFDSRRYFFHVYQINPRAIHNCMVQAIEILNSNSSH